MIVSAGLAIAVTVTSGSAEPRPADLDQRIASAWHELEIVIEQFNAVREDLRDTDTRIEQVNGELVPLQQAIDEAQRDANRVASALYRGARMGSAGAVLNAGSPETFIDQLAVLAHLTRSQDRELARLAASRTRFERQRELLDRLGTRQQGQQADLAARKVSIGAEIERLDQLRGRANRGRTPRTSRGALSDGYVPAFTPDAAGAAVRFAYAQLGKVYRFAAEGPDAYDCSGLTMAAWKAAGKALPHNAARQYRTVQPITREQLRPGDLVFYYRRVSHVAMYVGDGRVIEAPQHGERISVRRLDFAPIVGYGRP